MSDMLASALVMVSQFALMFALGLSVVGYRLFKRWRSDHTQAKSFVEKLREKEPERNSKRIVILKEKYNLQDEDIQTYIEKLLESEKSLYGKIINIFLGKKKDLLNEIDEDLEALINSCYVTAAGAAPAASEEAEDDIEISVDSPEVGALQEENNALKKEVDRLNIELEETKAQSEEMLAEYVMMYGKEGDEVRHKVDDEREKVKQEIKSEAAEEDAKMIYKKQNDEKDGTQTEADNATNGEEESAGEESPESAEEKGKN